MPPERRSLLGAEKIFENHDGLSLGKADQSTGDLLCASAEKEHPYEVRGHMNVVQGPFGYIRDSIAPLAG